MNRTARFMSWRISGIVYLGWLPWTTAKTVYPRRSSSSRKPVLIASCPENQPPLTAQITAAPLAFALGREDVHGQRGAELAAVDHVLLAIVRRRVSAREVRGIDPANITMNKSMRAIRCSPYPGWWSGTNARHLIAS